METISSNLNLVQQQQDQYKPPTNTHQNSQSTTDYQQSQESQEESKQPEENTTVKQDLSSILYHNVCIEIGSSRVKIGIQPVLKDTEKAENLPFEFSSQPTKHFFLPLNQLTIKLSDHLTSLGVSTINRIALSSTGEVGSTPETEGIIRSCGTLRQIAKLKSFNNFKLVKLLLLNSLKEEEHIPVNSEDIPIPKTLHGQQGLKLPILETMNVILLNDGHSAGLGLLTWGNRLGLTSETVPSAMISLGTYPAIALLLQGEVIILDSRKLYYGDQHVSNLCAKKVVLKEISQKEFTENIMYKVIPLLEEACSLHLKIKFESLHRIFVVGGIANHLIQPLIESDETLSKKLILIPDDNQLYAEIIFPALSTYNPNTPNAIKLSENLQLEVKIIPPPPPAPEKATLNEEEEE